MKPKRAWTERDAVIVNTNDEFVNCIKEHGTLVTPGIAACRADCHRRMLYEYIEAGTFRKFVIFGSVHLQEAEFSRWMQQRNVRRSQYRLRVAGQNANSMCPLARCLHPPNR